MIARRWSRCWQEVAGAPRRARSGGCPRRRRRGGHVCGFALRSSPRYVDCGAPHLREGAIREAFRTLRPRGTRKPMRAFSFLEVEGRRAGRGSGPRQPREGERAEAVRPPALSGRRWRDQLTPPSHWRRDHLAPFFRLARMRSANASGELTMGKMKFGVRNLSRKVGSSKCAGLAR